MNGKVYVGDIGTELIADVGEDITTATVFRLMYKKSDGTKGHWDATQEGTTTLVYITKADDLDCPGEWEFQAYISMPAWSGRGETAKLTIHDEFE